MLSPLCILLVAAQAAAGSVGSTRGLSLHVTVVDGAEARAIERWAASAAQTEGYVAGKGPELTVHVVTLNLDRRDRGIQAHLRLDTGDTSPWTAEIDSQSPGRCKEVLACVLEDAAPQLRGRLSTLQFQRALTRAHRLEDQARTALAATAAAPPATTPAPSPRRKLPVPQTEPPVPQTEPPVAQTEPPTSPARPPTVQTKLPAIHTRPPAVLARPPAVQTNMTSGAATTPKHAVNIGYAAFNVDMGVSDLESGVWAGFGGAASHELYLPSGFGASIYGAVSRDVISSGTIGSAHITLGWFSHRLIARDYGKLERRTVTRYADGYSTHEQGTRIGRTRSPRILGAYVAPRLISSGYGSLAPGALVAFRSVNVEGPDWAPRGGPEWGHVARPTARRFDAGLYYEGGYEPGGGVFLRTATIYRWFVYGMDLYLGVPFRMETPIGVGWVSAPDLRTVRN